MSSLVLLVLLAFFFVVALAFTVWAALNVGSAARRMQAAAEYTPMPSRSKARRDSEPRERKPWERVPEPAAPKERRQRKSRKEDSRPAPIDVSAVSGSRGPVVQGTLWEKRPEPTPAPNSKSATFVRGQTTTALRVDSTKPTGNAAARRESQGKQQADAQTQLSGKAVVTPRKPDGDAFERFLEAEKRRD